MKSGLYAARPHLTVHRELDLVRRNGLSVVEHEPGPQLEPVGISFVQDFPVFSEIGHEVPALRVNLEQSGAPVRGCVGPVATARAGD